MIRRPNFLGWYFLFMISCIVLVVSNWDDIGRYVGWW